MSDRVEDLAATFRQVLSRSSALPLRAVFLYGSVLGPGFRADRDIDLAVLVDAADRLSWGDQARLMGGRAASLTKLMSGSKVASSGGASRAGKLERYAREVRAAVDPAPGRDARSRRSWNDPAGVDRHPTQR